MAAFGPKCVQPLRNLLACSSHFPHQLVPQLRLLTSTSCEFIKTDLVGTDGRVGLVTLNRPKALNTLCAGLKDELIKALNELDGDPKIVAIVITGSQSAFAAGADIKEIQGFASNYRENFLEYSSNITMVRKPIIAAVTYQEFSVIFFNHLP